MPQSPSSIKRASMPPYSNMSYNSQSYKASPLHRALTPPSSHSFTGPALFPSVETSMESTSTQSSGRNFHMSSSGLSNSSDTTSPTFYSHPVQIYCTLCRRRSVLKDSFACTECISGFCSDCIYRLSSEQHQGRPRSCPKCQVVGPRYKAFQLELT